MPHSTIKTYISDWSSKCDTLDIELIISHVIKKDRVFIITHPEYIINPKEYNRIKKLCKQRILHHPLAYIIGHKEFYGRDFNITKDTLVPRPETEILIDSVLLFILTKKISKTLVIDIGTGSGIIPITLTKELIYNKVLPDILASDLSEGALAIAKQNTKLHNTTNIHFYHSDLLHNADLQNMIMCKKYDDIIITANLPYVDAAIKNALLQQPESSSLYHEPDIALWSDDNGLTHYKKLITQTAELCQNINHKKRITSFYEIDPKQSRLITHYLHKTLPENITVKCTKDHSNKDRLLQWTLHKNT